MKIWVTRDTTGSLHAGGLERCRVWFTKPTYHYAYVTNKQFDDCPFGNNEMRGLGRSGWRVQQIHGKGVVEDISFGKLFGYGEAEDPLVQHIDGLAEYVWKKLNEHYGNTEFVNGWYEYEKAGLCKQEDFLLEIELDVKFNN